jgi:hypothetical protein
MLSRERFLVIGFFQPARILFPRFYAGDVSEPSVRILFDRVSVNFHPFSLAVGEK